jgi:hypothetical protein
MRVDLSNLLNTFVFFILSSSPRALSYSTISKQKALPKGSSFLLPTLTSTSSFHLFQSTFKALSLQATIKLEVPWKWQESHHYFTLSKKPSDLSNMFSNFKYLHPL